MQLSPGRPDAPPAGPSGAAAQRALDLALEVGDALLSGGASASEVTGACTAVAEAGGLRRVECDTTFTSITLVGSVGPGSTALTGMRLVARQSLDYARVAEVHGLVRDLVAGQIGTAEAAERLAVVLRARHPYRRPVVTAARAVLATSVAVLLGAGPLVTAVAFAATVAIDLVLVALDRIRLPVFFQNAAGGLVATGAALALVAADADVRPSLVVAACIVLLLPGVTLVGAVQDAITGSYVTAGARAFETFLLTAGIVSGIAIGLSIGVRAGLPVRLGDPPIPGLAEVPGQLAAAGLASASFAIAYHAPRRTVAPCGLLGVVAWATFVAVDTALLAPTIASAAGAALVGAGAYALAARQRVPTMVYVASGIIPLLPGLIIYRGMRRFVEGDSVGGLTLLGSAIAVGLALGAGAILGEYLAAAARRGDPRHLRRLAGLRVAGRRRSRSWPDGRPVGAGSAEGGVTGPSHAPQRRARLPERSRPGT